MANRRLPWLLRALLFALGLLTGLGGLSGCDNRSGYTHKDRMRAVLAALGSS